LLSYVFAEAYGVVAHEAAEDVGYLLSDGEKGKIVESKGGVSAFK
jgi:hypothetical protein